MHFALHEMRRAHLSILRIHAHSVGQDKDKMAIYIFSMKTISRSAGRSSVAAVAYIHGLTMTNPRDGLVHSYQGKQKGVLHSINRGKGFEFEPEQLWPMLELHHKRRDAVLAREIITAMPCELSIESNAKLLGKLVQELCDTHGVAVSAALHAPSADGDDRNIHAHVIYTSVDVACEGGQLRLGKKVVELDAMAMQRAKRPIPADVWRLRWQELVNEALAAEGVAAQVDCRSLVAQRADALKRGDLMTAEQLNRIPDIHLGPAAAGFERRTGRKSLRRTLRENQQKAYAKSVAVLKNIRASIESLALMLRAEFHNYSASISGAVDNKSGLIDLGRVAGLEKMNVIMKGASND